MCLCLHRIELIVASARNAFMHGQTRQHCVFCLSFSPSLYLFLPFFISHSLSLVHCSLTCRKSGGRWST